MARHEEASLAIRQARDLDPFNATNHALLGAGCVAAQTIPAQSSSRQQATTYRSEFWIGYIATARLSSSWATQI